MTRQLAFTGWVIALYLVLFVGISWTTPANALKLSDLVKKSPEVYLPSQLLPGEPATFTVKAKPGQFVKLILSSYAQGLELDNGVALRVGTPTVEGGATVPESGVVEITVTIPDSYEVLGDKQFVEAVVWSNPDQSDAQVSKVVDNSGLTTQSNYVAIGTPADPGATLVMPGGDANMTNLFRSVTTLNDVGKDPRKKQLLDDGAINRNRQLDRNLNAGPSSAGP